MAFKWKWWPWRKQPSVPEVRWIEHLQRIEAKPGDVFVMIFPHDVSDETAARLRHDWESHMNGAKCIVIGSGAKLGLVNADAISQPKADNNA